MSGATGTGTGTMVEMTDEQALDKALKESLYMHRRATTLREMRLSHSLSVKEVETRMCDADEQREAYIKQQALFNEMNDQTRRIAGELDDAAMGRRARVALSMATTLRTLEDNVTQSERDLEIVSVELAKLTAEIADCEEALPAPCAPRARVDVGRHVHWRSEE